jgi:hypothetical protein
MLGYAKNLEMLHVNLAGLTVRLIAHNPDRTAAQVQQLDDWPRTVGVLLTGTIIFFPQGVIDEISQPSPSLNRRNTDLSDTATPSRQPDRRWP